jgi:integrase/recombinase XerD
MPLFAFLTVINIRRANMNRVVSIYVRYKDPQGKRCFEPADYSGKASLKPQPGGIYYIRWYGGKKPIAKKVGSQSHTADLSATDPTDALKAQMRQEDVLAGKRPPLEERSTPGSALTLADAIEAFLGERSTQTDDLSLKRWRWELELFARVSGKTHLREIGRADCFTYMRWYQQRKKAPRTVYNRMVSLNVFLKWAKHAPDFVFSQRKDGGEIPDYAEKTVDRYYPLELKKFFAACDSESRLAYLFFLDTGCREREVMFACQDDFAFEPEDGEYASTYEVRPKPDLGFKTKKGKTRNVPLTPRLAQALQTWFAVAGPRRLVFVNRDGGPEGHFLYKLKNIAFKAGLNCGHCETGKKDEFGNIIPGTEKFCRSAPVCKNWTLHKMRRTWATMLLEQPGVNIYEVQERIGHSDLEMLKRYNAVAQARSSRSRGQMVKFAESVEV